MPDTEFMQYIVAQGGFAAAFVLIFFFYRKDVKSYTELWKTQAELNRQTTTDTLLVVKENTASNTRLIAVIDTMQGVQAQMLHELRFQRQASRRLDDKIGGGGTGNIGSSEVERL